MKIILRNFLTVLRRFKVATILNILGLTVAFAAFILIMMQVNYDHNYNKNIPSADAIYRVEILFQEKAQAIICRPLSEVFFGASPYIEGGVLVNSFGGRRVVEVEKYGDKVLYEEQFIPVSDGFPDVFTLDMKEGLAESVRQPEKVLIPESMALKMFGDESAIGLKIFSADQPNSSLTVGGVYRDFPQNSSLKNAIYLSMGDENKNSFGNFNYAVYVRLSDPDRVDEVLSNYMENYHKEAFKSAFGVTAEDVTLQLTPFENLHYIKNIDYDMEEKSSPQVVAVIFIIAIVLLLIGGINFTNFSMALTPMRIKSINTQKVMGAEESLLRRAILSEAVCICLLSYGLSLLVVFLFTHSELRNLVSGDVTFAANIPILLIALGLSFVLALFAGLYPAYYMTSFPPALVLKGSFGLSPKGRMLRNSLLGFQFIASFALIIGAGFMYLQNHYMQTTTLGYDKDQLIVTYLNGKVGQSKDVVINDLKQFAGIDAVTGAQFMLSSSDRYMGWGRSYRDREISFQCLPVDPNFLEVMGIPVVMGRDFRNDDERTADGVYIVNEKAFYDLELELNDRVDGAEIVGVIPDIKFASLRTEVIPMAFHIWGTEEWGSSAWNSCLYIRVNAGTNLKDAYQHVVSTLDSFDPGYPFKVRFFDEVLQQTYEKERQTTLLITLFSMVAIFISIVGVFGLVIFESQYRIREIGLRKVLGSTSGEVIAMFNKVYLRILAICFVLAAPVSYLLVKNWLENFAYRTPMHWWVFLVAFVIVAFITLLTVTFQNWRAANSDPVNSIKSE